VESRKEARFSAAPDFHIGRWLAQPTLNVIRDGAVVRRLEPQVMDLLAFLATTGGRVVRKDEKATPGDHPAIVEIVARHEGPESAAIARYWLGRQPDAFQVIRSVGGERVGFVANLRLPEITGDDIDVDPAIAIVGAYVERHGPARPGEEILYGRCSGCV
jgi:hypothetical protein